MWMLLQVRQQMNPLFTAWVRILAKLQRRESHPTMEAAERNQKDLDHKYVEQQVEMPKTKTDSSKVVVRSKYLKQKQDDKSVRQSIPCLNDCSVIGQRKTVNPVINKLSASIIEEGDRAIATNSCFHHERIYNDHEVAKEASISAMNEVAERTTNIHEMHHKIVKEEQNPSVEILSIFGTPNNVIPLNSISKNGFRGAATGKRKLDSDENLQKETLNSKHMRIDETDTAGNAETSFETNDVEKFGSNVSHMK